MNDIARLALRFLTFILVTQTALAAEIEIKWDKIHKIDLSKETSANIQTVYEPHEAKEVKYRALEFNKLLDRVLGEKWRLEEEILFTCADGYQPSLPVKLLKEHKAYLALAREGGEFRLQNSLQNNEVVQLAPSYLVWDNIQDKTIREHGASVWPYQVVRIEFVKFSDRFAKMAPPAQSSGAVKNGFLAFRQYCQSCHRINGQGGEKSIELNFPMNITEYYKKDVLRKWIDSPQSVRWAATMPPLSSEAPNRSQVLDNIIAYLEAMRSKKIKPE